MNSEVSESTNQGAGNLCPSCAALIDTNEMFCPECGAPISSVATLDPMQTIRAEGFLLRKATEGKPKLIVVIGVWLLFFPFPIAGLLIAANVAINGLGTGMAGFFFFWGGIALSIIGIAIIFKVTRNYFKEGPPRDKEHIEPI